MNGWLESCGRTWGPLLTARRAGAISSSESERLDRHLAGCARCRALAAELDVLKDVLVDAARRDSLDHPEPEELANLAQGTEIVSAADRERLERHLEACATCRAEWNVSRSWSPPAVLPPREVAIRPWAWFGAGAAVAASVAIGAVLLWPRGQDAGEIGLRPSAGPIQLRGSHHRAADEPTGVRVPPSGDLLVSLTVESAPGSALRVDLLRDDGSVVSAGRLVVSDPSGLIFVSVPASSVPRKGGKFRVALEATGETFEYPFRVLSDGD